jgi:two-component system nitrate/nitrite sensor histidine kinase NarX
MKDNHKSSQRSDADRAWRYLEGLQRISETIGSSISCEDLFQQTLDTILDVTRMEGAGFRLLNEDDECFCLVAHYGMSPEMVQELKCLPATNELHQEVAETRKPVVIHDMEQDRRNSSKESIHLGYKCLVSVPLIAGDQFTGTLELASKRNNTWSEEELRWLSAIGRLVGVAVRHVQLTEQVHQLAIRQERGRISQEIHDGISQLISAIRIRAETAELALEDGDETAVKNTLEDIKQVSDDAFASLRDEIISLREGAQRGKPFITILSEVLDRFQRQWGIATSVELIGEADDWALTPQVELQLLRIVQEAIANVHRHAHASWIKVRLNKEGDDLSLEIQDDGRGFDPEHVQEDQVGLRIMRERARGIGGFLGLDTHQNQGTRITIWVPTRIAQAHPGGTVSVYSSLNR